MKIYIVSAVRGADDDYRQALEEYTKILEDEGHQVYLPHREVPAGTSEYEACTRNVVALKEAEVVHVFFTPESRGSYFDLGVAWALGKPVKVIATSYDTEFGKSMSDMLGVWEENTKTRLMSKQELVQYHAQRIRKRILGENQTVKSREIPDSEKVENPAQDDIDDIVATEEYLNEPGDDEPGDDGVEEVDLRTIEAEEDSI